MQTYAWSATLLMAAMCGGCVDWDYEYSDDFSTEKAEWDAQDHSVFLPESAVLQPNYCLTCHADRPYLFRTSITQPAETLAFAGFATDPAYVEYCFPLEPTDDLQLSGAMELDAFDLGDGHLSYSVGDGAIWSFPVSLGFGHQQIPLASTQPPICIRLAGYDVAIDNLHVKLMPE